MSPALRPATSCTTAAPELEVASVSKTARRLAVVWVADWPVVAAIGDGLAEAHEPVALADGRQVHAVSAAARARGVRRGMKRRSAGAECPELKLLPVDPARDARLFEPVAALVEEMVPGVELLRPGLLLVPARGASRYHGGDAQLAEHLVTQLVWRGDIDAQVGIADGVLAGILAARSGQVVAPGGSPDFLAPMPIQALNLALGGTAHAEDLAALIDLLIRLGIHTCGALAALSSRAANARFGRIGQWAQRLVRAQDVGTATRRRSAPEFTAALNADPPLVSVEAAAFAARRLAEELHTQLIAHGQGYERLRIEAHTETGGTLERAWRLEGVDAAGVSDRVRWQLEGWLDGRSGAPPSGGLTRLALTAAEVHPAGVNAGRLWGDADDGQARAARGADRVLSMLGGRGVYVPVEQGGRDPRSRIRLVAWGDNPVPLRPLDRPWPGMMPDPAPATVPALRPVVAVYASDGAPVRISAAFEFSGEMAWLCPAQTSDAGAPDTDGMPLPGGVALPGEVPLPGGVARLPVGWSRPGASGTPRLAMVGAVIVDWAGPWPVVERWWSPDGRRRAFAQVQIAAGRGPFAGRGLLLAVEGDTWTVEGIYD